MASGELTECERSFDATIMRVAFAAITALLATLCGCSFTGGPVSGRVLDVETRKPVAGAIVVVRWEGSISSLVDSQSTCFHVETVTSDSEGIYQIPRWWQSPKLRLMFGGAAVAEAYKPGFESAHANENESNASPANVYLKSFAGTNAERFAYISERVFSGMNCLDAGDSQRNLFALFGAAFQEAKRLAVADQQRKTLEGLRRVAADAWLAVPADRRAVQDPVANLPPNVRRDLE